MLRDNASNSYMEITYRGHGINVQTQYSNFLKWAELRVHKNIFCKPRRLVLKSTASLRQNLKKL